MLFTRPHYTLCCVYHFLMVITPQFPHFCVVKLLYLFIPCFVWFSLVCQLDLTFLLFLPISNLLELPQPWQECVLDYSKIAASVCFFLLGFYMTHIFFFSLLLLTYVQDFLSMMERLPNFHSVFVGNFYSTLVAKQLNLMYPVWN